MDEYSGQGRLDRQRIHGLHEGVSHQRLLAKLEEEEEEEDFILAM